MNKILRINCYELFIDKQKLREFLELSDDQTVVGAEMCEDGTIKFEVWETEDIEEDDYQRID